VSEATEATRAPGTTRDALERARRRRFVGRTAELELLADALAAEEPPFVVLYVHGPGGVGKSALLRALADLAAEAGATPVLLDGRDVDPSPERFLAALGRATGAPAGADPLAALRAVARPALFLDTYERLAPLDRWIRERVLPELPGGGLAVLAGRAPPAPEWRTDPSWQDLVRVVSLRNLPPEDGDALLEAAGVPASVRGRALALTHGHPLALSLVGDLLRQAPGESLEGEMPPDVVQTLLRRFLDEAPSAAHRRALEVAAHVRVTTESLLRPALGGSDDAHALFAWLGDLSFVERAPDGLVPHELARDVIDADLRWRDPTGYAELHLRCRDLALERLRSAGGEAGRRAPFDIIFMHRNNALVRPFWDWASMGQTYAEPAGGGDRPGILAMTARHEGATSAALAAHWLDRQPGAFLAFRAGPGSLVGFMAYLDLDGAADEDRRADPVTAAAWDEAERRRPRRPGEHVRMLRFAMDAEAHQQPSPGFNLVSGEHLRRIVADAQLGWDFIAWVRDDVLDPLMRHVDFAPLLRVGEIEPPIAVYAHDWRAVPVDEWFRPMGARELGEAAPDERPPPAAAPVVVLSQPDFAAAVRRALRDLHRPDRLAANPLLRSALVRARGGSEPPPACLAEVVRDAVGRVGDHPRDEPLVRALDRTFLRPAATQERAAAILGLPFSTYRRHLARGVERVVGLLWEEELHGAVG
jgi:hypothetical protein